MAGEKRITCCAWNLDREGLSAERDFLTFDIDRNFDRRLCIYRSSKGLNITGTRNDAGHPERRTVSEENFGVALGDHGAEASFGERLRCMFPRTATTKIDAGNQNARLRESLLVQGVWFRCSVLLVSHVVEQVFAETVEGDAFHEPSRNNPVCINVRTWDVDGFTGDRSNFFEGHEKIQLRRELFGPPLPVLKWKTVPPFSWEFTRILFVACGNDVGKDDSRLRSALLQRGDDASFYPWGKSLDVVVSNRDARGRMSFIIHPKISALIAALLSVSSLALYSQNSTAEETDFLAELDAAANWKKEGTGKLGDIAKLEIPGGYRFTERDGAERILAQMGNPPSDTRYGLVGPESLTWFAVFDWDNRGFVEDTDKDQLNPDDLLKDLKKINKTSSKARAEAGYGSLDLVGWAYPPHYNEQTNNLEWALDLVDGEGNHVVNYQTKLLGRFGVMEAILVCSPDELEEFLPQFQSMLKGFEFVGGKKYSEFTAGDKVAKGGLIALIAGGAVFAAAKTGVLGLLLLKLKKLWIFLLAGIIFLFRKIKGFFTGRDE